MIQLEIPLFEHLQDAIAAPQEAQLLELLQEFDTAILGLGDQQLLEVAADAILQLATIVEAKYVGVIEEVRVQGQSGASSDPTVPIDFFDRFVRQSMLVNFEQFVEPIPLLPLPSPLEVECQIFRDSLSDYLSESAMVKAICEVMIDDAGVLLDALPDRSPKQQEFDAILELSHGEGIQTWTTELVSMMEKLQHRKRQSVSFLDLICTLESSRTDSERKDCLIDLWLTFLLGKHSYGLRRTAHDFYSPVGIGIVLDG